MNLKGIILTDESERLKLAEEIIRRVDTVALLRCEEVADIRARAVDGEFDAMARDLLNAR